MWQYSFDNVARDAARCAAIQQAFVKSGFVFGEPMCDNEILAVNTIYRGMCVASRVIICATQQCEVLVGVVVGSIDSQCVVVVRDPAMPRECRFELVSTPKRFAAESGQDLWEMDHRTPAQTRAWFDQLVAEAYGTTIAPIPRPTVRHDVKIDGVLEGVIKTLASFHKA